MIMVGKGKQVIKSLVPAKVVQSRMHKHAFKQFAEKVGFVYFGYVDQKDDEHRLVRGLTVSTKHRDNHYCIGSYDGYDVTLVERTDTIHFPGKPKKTHNWIIMSFDLHMAVDLPHVFVGLNTHSDVFYAHLFTKFTHFAKVHSHNTPPHSVSFTDKYSIYAKPEQALSAERIFHSTITQAVAEKFGALTLEIHEGVLYVYAEHQRPTAALFDKMLVCGVWLAQHLDRHDDTPAE